MNGNPPSRFWDTMNVETGYVTRLTAFRMPDGSFEYHADRASADRAAKQIVAMHRYMADTVIYPPAAG